MPNLLLVKHSLPDMDFRVPASHWHLSEAGRRRCPALAARLAEYYPSLIVSSTEPKAVETAELVAEHLGITCTIAVGLHEHERPNRAWMSREQFEAAVSGFFLHPDELVMGQETAAQARARFARALAGVVQTNPNKTIAVVAHGTVITLFVSQQTGIAPFPFWQQLGLPSFVVLPLPTMDSAQLINLA